MNKVYEYPKKKNKIWTTGHYMYKLCKLHNLRIATDF